MCTGALEGTEPKCPGCEDPSTRDATRAELAGLTVHVLVLSQASLPEFVIQSPESRVASMMSSLTQNLREVTKVVLSSQL